eukprot:TRINITY_DN6273_c0_g2_i1.p1 TRINITY_DN6273_c0_g2~~TRINITY_DN6273_c0_g2_i1.p1  ORF type:complete len:757 (+),score=95.88 TRINITY_DN6273_c0_g2_i1:197-2272(+)
MTPAMQARNRQARSQASALPPQPYNSSSTSGPCTAAVQAGPALGDLHAQHSRATAGTTSVATTVSVRRPSTQSRVSPGPSRGALVPSYPGPSHLAADGGPSPPPSAVLPQPHPSSSSIGQGTRPQADALCRMIPLGSVVTPLAAAVSESAPHLPTPPSPSPLLLQQQQSRAVERTEKAVQARPRSSPKAHETYWAGAMAREHGRREAALVGEGRAAEERARLAEARARQAEIALNTAMAEQEELRAAAALATARAQEAEEKAAAAEREAAHRLAEGRAGLEALQKEQQLLRSERLAREQAEGGAREADERAREIAASMLEKQLADRQRLIRERDAQARAAVEQLRLQRAQDSLRARQLSRATEQTRQAEVRALAASDALRQQHLLQVERERVLKRCAEQAYQQTAAVAATVRQPQPAPVRPPPAAVAAAMKQAASSPVVVSATVRNPQVSPKRSLTTPPHPLGTRSVSPVPVPQGQEQLQVPRSQPAAQSSSAAALSQSAPVMQHSDPALGQTAPAATPASENLMDTVDQQLVDTVAVVPRLPTQQPSMQMHTQTTDGDGDYAVPALDLELEEGAGSPAATMVPVCASSVGLEPAAIGPSLATTARPRPSTGSVAVSEPPLARRSHPSAVSGGPEPAAVGPSVAEQDIKPYWSAFVKEWDTGLKDTEVRKSAEQEACEGLPANPVARWEQL